jgi:exonuclease VII small subunit
LFCGADWTGKEKRQKQAGEGTALLCVLVSVLHVYCSSGGGGSKAAAAAAAAAAAGSGCALERLCLRHAALFFQFAYVEESKAALDAATANLARTEQAVRDLTAQLAEAEKQLAAWRGKESELATTQRTQQELVDRMFAAPVWGSSPTLNALTDATRALEAQAAEQGRGGATYGNGTKLLTSAAQKLEGAIKALQGTQFMNMMGMRRGMMVTAATGRPGMMQPNMMQNIAEMAILRKANDAVASAAQDTAQARQLLGPGLPQVNEEIMKAARAGIFQNVLFGGVMSDVMQAAAVAKSVRAVEQMLGEVRKAAQWAQANLTTYQHRHAELSAQVSAKQAEAQAYRTSALRTALEAPAAAATAGVEQLSLI